MSVDVTHKESVLGRALARLLDESVDAVVHLGPAVLRAPRLDRALDVVDETVRAVERAAALQVPLVVASTLGAVGRKKGLVAEEDPRNALFGGSSTRGRDIDVDAELRACRSAVQHARAQAHFADTHSRIADETRRALLDHGGATTGSAFQRAFDDACKREETKLLERALVERASGWQFATGSSFATLGYAAALSELVAMREAEKRDVAVAIARLPDVLDHEDGALAWLVELVRSGVVRIPIANNARLEALPLVDVAHALSLVVRGAASSKQGGVVHVVTPEPLLGSRLGDLLDLHLRRRNEKGLVRALSVATTDTRPPLTSLAATALSFARDLLPSTNALDLPSKLRDVVDEAARTLTSVVDDNAHDRARGASAPFFSDETRFSQRGLRMFAARASVDVEKSSVAREGGWRTALLDDHLPKLDDAHASRTRAKAKLPRPAYDSLVHLLDEVSTRYHSRPALTLLEGDAIVDVTYAELAARARAVALRLRKAGVQRGDRVLLAGANHPAWGITAFGVVVAGAICVPLDPGLDVDAVARIAKKARPKLAVVDKAQRTKWQDALPEPVLDLHLTVVEGPGLDDDEARALAITGDDVASILFTSGTTGDPKGVELLHKNFTSLLASLQSIFPVGRGDRLLSVLPLHHTFEFSGGFLMPLAAGARIYTPDALTGERVLYALKTGKITAMVGVPALWQLLERRIRKQASERGDVVETVLDTLLSANRAFAKSTGLSFGKLAFKPIHDELGGHLKTLISGGSALPPSVYELFQGLGLPLAEGYGLTEAAPVLTVAEGILGAPAGTVGKPIPGVELKIVPVDEAGEEAGVGEIWARAPNVMRGYFEDEGATSSTLVDGWLKTGDLGSIDHEGKLRILGRNKDVVVSATGENIYLDDIEKKLEQIDGVSELTLLGMPDPRGGERLALAWVLAAGAHADDAQRNLQHRVLKLPAFARPAVVERVDGPLPLTATRKVKRKEVRKTVEAILAKKAEAESTTTTTAMSAVRTAIATIAGVDVKKVTSSTRLPQDLGFDSLMWTELQSALEPTSGKLDPEKLVAAESVSAIEHLVRTNRATETADAHAIAVDERLSAPETATSTEPRSSTDSIAAALSDLALTFAKPLGRAAITAAQREAYRTVFSSTVTGRSFIPSNRNAIVIANHTSHLDTGLVKFALGEYGRDLRPLAAKDYFFEGAAPKVAFFEHFTNLVPIDRETGSGLAFEQARAVVDAGHVVLVFPEGTRREDGTLGGFKPLVARLSLETGVDVLPIWMKGNYEALPRGTHFPKARALEAHIGPPLEAKELARLTAHLPRVQQARAATDVLKRAIVALSEGRMLDLSRVTSLDDLERGLVTRPAADPAPQTDPRARRL